MTKRFNYSIDLSVSEKAASIRFRDCGLVRDSLVYKVKDVTTITNELVRKAFTTIKETLSIDDGARTQLTSFKFDAKNERICAKGVVEIRLNDTVTILLKTQVSSDMTLSEFNTKRCVDIVASLTNTLQAHARTMLIRLNNEKLADELNWY